MKLARFVILSILIEQQIAPLCQAFLGTTSWFYFIILNYDFAVLWLVASRFNARLSELAIIAILIISMITDVLCGAMAVAAEAASNDQALYLQTQTFSDLYDISYTYFHYSSAFLTLLEILALFINKAIDWSGKNGLDFEQRVISNLGNLSFIQSLHYLNYNSEYFLKTKPRGKGK